MFEVVRSDRSTQELLKAFKEVGVLLNAVGEHRYRVVTHLDASKADVEDAAHRIGHALRLNKDGTMEHATEIGRDIRRGFVALIADGSGRIKARDVWHWIRSLPWVRPQPAKGFRVRRVRSAMDRKMRRPRRFETWRE